MHNYERNGAPHNWAYFTHRKAHMKAIGIGIVGLAVLLLALGDNAESNSGAWQRMGYASYTDCKNSPETALKGVEYKIMYPNVSDKSIKYIICN